MPYDAALDKEIEKREVTVDGQVYEVSLRAYNNGEPKISISLQNGRFPVKRLTPKVFLAIADAVRTMGFAEASGPA
ncbi:MAG: hypothetical protein AAB368_05705 [bacterium]